MRLILFLLLPLFAFGQTRYVTPTGAGTHDGTSEANAWTMAEALANDAPGMTIYVKAGSYSPFTISSSGTVGNYIKYIGYDNTAGDIVTTNGSTFGENDAVSAAVMPLVTKSSSVTGINITGNYVHLENFQVTGGTNIGINVVGGFFIGDNLIVTEVGTQNVYSAYDGVGIIFGAPDNTFSNGSFGGVFADNFILRDSFVKNCTAENINNKGSDNGLIQRTTSFCNNPGNPTDYYFNASYGASNNIIENSVAKRTAGLAHGGHGFNFKDWAKNNIVRNCDVFGTSLEVNFSGVSDNLFENCRIYGQGTTSSTWHTRIFIANGAQNNTFRNIYMQNVWSAIMAGNYDDGFVGPGGDRDLEEIGRNNVFENIIINNADRIYSNSYGTGDSSGPAVGFIFRNITAENIVSGFTLAMPHSDFEFYNIGVSGKSATNAFFSVNPTPPAAGSITNFLYSNNLYHNANGTFPSGWASSTDPLFINAAGTTPESFMVQTGSPWIDAGTSVEGTTSDFGGDSPNGTRDVGAWEFGGSPPPPGDETPPSVATRTVTNVTEQSFTVDWTTDEASKGRIYFDTDTGTVAGDYANQTALENGFLTRHIQSPGPGNPSALSAGTTYYYRIYTEDAAGNTALSAEFTQATLGAAPDPDPPALIGKGVKSRNLKKRKF